MARQKRAYPLHTFCTKGMTAQDLAFPELETYPLFLAHFEAFMNYQGKHRRVQTIYFSKSANISALSAGIRGSTIMPNHQLYIL